MPNLYIACKQLVDMKFKEVVGPVAEKNGFKFRNYTYYREINGILQSFALQNCCIGWFEVWFFVSPTSMDQRVTGSGNGLSYFDKDNKYHMNGAGSWNYNVEPELITSYMNEAKEIVEEKLIPLFDSLTDERALLDFYNSLDDDHYNAVLNLYLKLEDYKKAEEMIRDDIERTITHLYNDIHGLSEHPYKRGGRSYLFYFDILAKEALMLKNLEEGNYDYFKDMINEYERITAEFLKHPKFDRL